MKLQLMAGLKVISYYQVEELTKLAEDIEKLYLDINKSRLEGFLKEALEKK